MKVFNVRFNSLPVQMILSFIGLVLLTAVAAGTPAIWLLRQQLESQAWAQVTQGSQAAQALYAAQQNEVANLATLTAQRPTLQELLTLGDQTMLQSYLQTLQAGAGLDLVLVCDSDRQIVAQAGEFSNKEVCLRDAPSGFFIVATEKGAQAWLLATHVIENQLSDQQESVLVGFALDETFVKQIREQTGLEHTLLVESQPIATSLSGGLGTRQAASTALVEQTQWILTVANQPYYTLRQALTASQGGDLTAEVALPVANIATTQRNLVWTLIASILTVAAVGSSVGVLLARRISRPLARLAKAATRFSQGDLAQPVLIDARLREVALLGSALEAARVDLNLTLGELQREKAWTDHLLEAIVEGIVTLDRQGRIVFFSRGAERITGWSRDEALGRLCNEIFPTLETDPPFSQLFSPQGRRQKIIVTLRDGRQAILAVTGAQLLPPEGSEARQVLVFRDVSETEAIHRIMGHFMANIAHEFRTPLSALAASIELLLDQTPTLTAAELQELVTSLHLGILRLQTLVDNLLEGASIEAGRFRVYTRPVSLDQIMSEATQTMQPLLHKYGQQLMVDLPETKPVVLADPRRTVQVLVNLLANANKYGPAEAIIRVGATLDDGWVRLTVADRGPGISSAYRADLFGRFVYPAQGADKAQYGVGLGLSVVKAIVEAQGGTVGVEDRPGGGSIFWFTLAREGEA